VNNGMGEHAKERVTVGNDVPAIQGVPKDLTREELSIAFRVIEALRDMRFGSVQLQVHDGKVVQIDVAEKLRLRHPMAPPASPARPRTHGPESTKG
jgi:hypothetical protein